MQKILKTVMWWGLGTIAAVPLTKVAESLLDVSFFSPYIVGLWNWVKGVWSALGSDVSLPLWLMLLLSLMSVLLVVVAGVLAYAAWFEKGKEAPVGAPLTDDQQRVFVVVGKAIQEGHKVAFDEIRQYSRLSRIATQNALDHLYNVGLIKSVRSAHGFQYTDLTPLGRDHYLELEKLYGWGAAR
ncbi:hypothetical protein [Pseudomonas hunanensis]|uniref:hypothetical protein n=1 Tax=Pseudomonas hunanensis TaxID=1247546 RepID=UPI0037F9E93E